VIQDESFMTHLIITTSPTTYTSSLLCCHLTSVPWTIKQLNYVVPDAFSRWQRLYDIESVRRRTTQPKELCWKPQIRRRNTKQFSADSGSVKLITSLRTLSWEKAWGIILTGRSLSDQRNICHNNLKLILTLCACVCVCVRACVQAHVPQSVVYVSM
jgi:hypothetical protein